MSILIETSIISALDRYYGSSYEKLTNEWLNGLYKKWRLGRVSRKRISEEIMGFFCIED